MGHTVALRKERLSTKSFGIIKDIVRTRSGISLSAEKQELVNNRLRKRLKVLRLDSYRKYCELLQSESREDEIPYLIDAISTNITSFFRERSHYRILFDHVLPAIFEKMSAKNSQIRIWSSACASGEEPYSIAMVTNAFSGDQHVDIKILATDICSDVLETASIGCYHKQKLEEVPGYFRQRYFQPYNEEFFKVNKKIVDMITFRKLNLIEQFPFKRKFDIIFCRNVLIYFESEIQTQLIQKFYKCLNPGGYLFLGHAESLNGKSGDFKYVAPAVYRKDIN